MLKHCLGSSPGITVHGGEEGNGGGGVGVMGAPPHKLGHAGPCQLHPRSARVEALPGHCLQNPLETTSLSFIIAVSESCSGFRSSSYDRGPGRRRSQGVFWVSGRCFRKTAALEARLGWWWVSGTSVNSPEPRRSHAEVRDGWGKWRMSNNFVNYLELPRRENPFCSKPASFQLPLRACITHSIFFCKNIILFLYFWLCWVFVAARATLKLRCSGFSLPWFVSLQSAVSRVWGFSSWGRGLSSCGLAARGMWDPPGAGIEPVSPALQGRIPNHWATREAHPQHLCCPWWRGWRRMVCWSPSVPWVLGTGSGYTERLQTWFLSHRLSQPRQRCELWTSNDHTGVKCYKSTFSKGLGRGRSQWVPGNKAVVLSASHRWHLTMVDIAPWSCSRYLLILWLFRNLFGYAIWHAGF